MELNLRQKPYHTLVGFRNDHVYEWLKIKGFEDRLTEHSETIDTVEQASDAVGWSDVCKGWEENGTV